jgi:hypothetical protein
VLGDLGDDRRSSSKNDRAHRAPAPAEEREPRVA